MVFLETEVNYFYICKSDSEQDINYTTFDIAKPHVLILILSNHFNVDFWYCFFVILVGLDVCTFRGFHTI